MNDKEIAEKVKPYIKQFNFTHEQLQTLAVCFKRNPEKLQNCIDYLVAVEKDNSTDNIVSTIIEICYR